MIWLWVVGAVVLVAGATVPPLLARRRTARRAHVAARDRAHAAMSRLEWALDVAGAGPSDEGGRGDGGDQADRHGVADADAAPDPGAIAEARRCFTLAGSALAGTDTTGGFAEAETWARRGLAALGQDAPGTPAPE